ncbi:Hypothetical protein PHPALM_18342, partial [Phytophthora palmivora]
TTSIRFLITAFISAVFPSLSATFISAPCCSMRSRTISRALHPSSYMALKSTPTSVRYRTTSTCPDVAAFINAVSLQLFLALTSTLHSPTRNWTISKFPFIAALISKSVPMLK